MNKTGIKVKFTIIAIYMSPITIPDVLGTVLPKRPITTRPEGKHVHDVSLQRKQFNGVSDYNTIW